MAKLTEKIVVIVNFLGEYVPTIPERLREDQRIPDHLAELGEMTQRPDANIIKLPNISASIPQLQAAINRFVKEHNIEPKPFNWTADPDKIIAAVRRGHQVLDSNH